MALTLHTYFRSSAAYRVRIALNLKGLKADPVFVHLNRNGGEQFSEAFRAINPQALVPVLSADGFQLSQSLAIMEYLDDIQPEPRLLPTDARDRAFVRQLSLAMACDIHPLNNLRVLKFLTGRMGLSEAQKSEWVAHWIGEGLAAVEAQLAQRPVASRFCLGDAPTMADCCLVPQVFSAQRFNLDLSACPLTLAIHEGCQALPAFQMAHPAVQADAE